MRPRPRARARSPPAPAKERAAGAGCASLTALPENIGAGSRTVERRRGGLCGSRGFRESSGRLYLAGHRLERLGRGLRRFDGCFHLSRPAEIGDGIRDFRLDTVLVAYLALVVLAVPVLRA
ncbi:MAG: hypothetical protein WDO17_17520 [Alphaproteobacteria bacterium]